MNYLVSVNEIAEILNLTARRVQQLAENGVIPKPVARKYALKPTVQAYVQYIRQNQEVKNAGSATQADLIAEQYRLTKVRADRFELDLGQQRGDLLPRVQTQAAWTAMVAHMRARLLSIPTKAAPLVIACQRHAEAERTIKQFIYEALSELKETEIEITPVGTPDIEDDGAIGLSDGSTSTPADRKRVGGRKKKVIK